MVMKNFEVSTGKTITLTTAEVHHLLKDIMSNAGDLMLSASHKEFFRKYKNNHYAVRGYHPNQKIKELFEKYHTKEITKQATFERIAKELNITFKAVKKAYYHSTKLWSVHKDEPIVKKDDNQPTPRTKDPFGFDENDFDEVE
jgi:DNA-directed RNA polymerase specialized sigma subunit